MDTLKEHGVRAIRPDLCKEAITTMAFVTLAPDGNRSFTFARKPGADMFLCEQDIKQEDIADSVIVHAGSCSLSASPVDAATVRALRLGHELKKLVSFDVNYRNLMWNDDAQACAERVKQILPYVDLLKISDEEVGMFGGEACIPELMKQYQIQLVVLTLGAAGAKCYFGEQVIPVAGRKATCMDATGAGDAFWGGFLSSLRLQGVEHVEQITEEIVKTALEYGNIAGWICVQSKGAIPSLPTKEQIEQYLGGN